MCNYASQRFYMRGIPPAKINCESDEKRAFLPQLGKNCLSSQTERETLQVKLPAIPSKASAPADKLPHIPNKDLTIAEKGAANELPKNHMLNSSFYSACILYPQLKRYKQQRFRTGQRG